MVGLFDWINYDEIWEKREITLSFKIRRNKAQELLLLTKKLNKTYGPSTEKDYYFDIEVDICFKGNVAIVKTVIKWWYDTEVAVEVPLKKDLLTIIEKILEFVIYN